MQGRALDGMVGGAGQRSQRQGLHGRSRCGGARVFQGLSGLLGASGGQRHRAHPALARSHRSGGVSLEQFHLAKPLAHGLAYVLEGDVLTQTDELFGTARRHHCPSMAERLSVGLFQPTQLRPGDFQLVAQFGWQGDESAPPLPGRPPAPEGSEWGFRESPSGCPQNGLPAEHSPAPSG